MNQLCPKCNLQYGDVRTDKSARVLPCGHTYCYICIHNYTLNTEFKCFKCGSINIIDKLNIPINMLYYQMLLSFTAYEARREYDNPTEPIIHHTNSFSLNYDTKCMNPFCLKPRYRNQQVSELFCSKKCRQIHQQASEQN